MAVGGIGYLDLSARLKGPEGAINVFERVGYGSHPDATCISSSSPTRVGRPSQNVRPSSS